MKRNNLILCSECEPRHRTKIGMVKGDGRCDKHGRFVFQYHYLKEKCRSCARDKGICQACGKNLER